ncbi:MAG: hypothetical protein AAB250_05115, partial [Bdellovibrionota bacterium]
TPTPVPPTATPTPTPVPPTGGYVDDTHASLAAASSVLTVAQNYGYNRYTYTAAADGKSLALDMRNAVFTLANSKNSYPTESNDCNSGSLQTNHYPLIIENADQTALVGLLMNGIVPQDSDWRPSYCNSAGLNIRNAKDTVVDGIRMTAHWDGVREAEGSENLVIKNSWFSGGRDEVVENDFRNNLTVRDVLSDGTYNFISVRPSSSNIDTVPDGSNKVLLVSGVVVRFRSALQEGTFGFGAPFKSTDTGAPKSKIYNSIFAVEPGGGVVMSSSNWPRGWKDLIDCKNNLFLWMSDRALPSGLGTIPACFTIIKGQAAYDTYNRARMNWINCHPKVPRAAGEPTGDPSQCRAGDFGGFGD